MGLASLRAQDGKLIHVNDLRISIIYPQETLETIGDLEMKSLLEKISHYWQLRFLAVALVVSLVVYAVLMPDPSNTSRESSIPSVAAAPSTVGGEKALSQAEAPVLKAEFPAEIDPGFMSDRDGSWLGADSALADQLESIVHAELRSGLAMDISESIWRLRKAANQGDPAAQFLLGHAYDNGFGVAKDVREAVRWYRRAAEEHRGDGATPATLLPVKDFFHAFESYRSAAQRGDLSAQLYLALAYDTGRDVSSSPVEAVRWYRIAARAGSAAAACNLGRLFHNGDGMPKDSAEAAIWFRSAADRGNMQAQYSIGRVYYEGDGVPQDYEEAARWFRKAADQGNGSAQVFLSYLYATGKGVRENSPMAYMWMNLASTNQTLARSSREQMEKILPPAQIAEGQRLTHAWLLHHDPAAE